MPSVMLLQVCGGRERTHVFIKTLPAVSTVMRAIDGASLARRRSRPSSGPWPRTTSCLPATMAVLVPTPSMGSQRLRHQETWWPFIGQRITV